MPTQQTLEAAIPSMECLSHHLPLRLAQSLADRLDGICLGVYQCRCFLPRHPCRCSDLARSAVGVEGRGIYGEMPIKKPLATAFQWWPYIMTFSLVIM